MRPDELSGSLPASQGGYYNLDSLLLMIAAMYLRIKNFEQLKHHSPGELGKLFAYDRVPEVKTMRKLVREFTAQKPCGNWSADLSGQLIGRETPQVYYVDGHVQVYHYELANLGKKHVSRQRLYLPGMMEFWVNSPYGMPYFFITAPVNEKMIEILKLKIVPQLLQLHTVTGTQKQLMEQNPNYPLFTLVFDREGYSPSFFLDLWTTHRIAVITYRKNMKDRWDESLFADQKVETSMGATTMKLSEQSFTADGYPMRETRKLSPDGHQTSIVTTNRIMTIAMIATYMFGRWIQENYFRVQDEVRALVKSVIMLNIDLHPDERNKILEITLYPLANKRNNAVVEKIIDLVNQTKTVYPGMDLVLIFKIKTI